MVTAVPAPGSLSNVIVPDSSSTRPKTTGRPRPVPTPAPETSGRSAAASRDYLCSRLNKLHILQNWPDIRLSLPLNVRRKP